MVISDWIFAGISPSRCSCSLSRIFPRGAFCSLLALSTVVSSDCRVSCLGICSIVFLEVFVGPFHLGLFFSSFCLLGWNLEVFRFCHCFSDVLFAHFLRFCCCPGFLWFLFLFFPRWLYYCMRLDFSLFRMRWPIHVFWGRFFRGRF